MRTPDPCGYIARWRQGKLIEGCEREAMFQMKLQFQETESLTRKSSLLQVCVHVRRAHRNHLYKIRQSLGLQLPLQDNSPSLIDGTLADGLTNRQTDRQTGRQAGRQTDRQRQSHRVRERYVKIQRCTCMSPSGKSETDGQTDSIRNSSYWSLQ